MSSLLSFTSISSSRASLVRVEGRVRACPAPSTLWGLERFSACPAANEQGSGFNRVCPAYEKAWLASSVECVRTV
jgi:hypothetical protein